jgi:hypothetical protein
MSKNPSNTEALFELEEAVGKLLPSQREFIFSPESFGVIAGGYGSGKSRALCVKALVLSACIPGNAGLIGRYNATDLQDSTMPVFFEVCPPSWIKDYNKTRRAVTFKNNSSILFRHIHDPNPKRRHITSTNLGWFAIDQLEECEIEHYNTLVGRLRLPRAPKRFGFGAANPNGHDWMYNLFFKNVGNIDSGFYKTVRRGNRLGVAVLSDENRRSNGGFVDDEYFDNMREEFPPEWVARYMDCSFDDFAGKIFSTYSLASVHNIAPFPVPSHWQHIITIDCGGEHPWAVLDQAIDDWGNVVVCQEFFKRNVTIHEIVYWLKEHTKWNDFNTLFVIDWENRQASIELAEHGIHCRPANKDVRSGIIRAQSYLHVNKSAKLPPWFEETQSPEAFQAFKDRGAPREFIFRTCLNARRQHDAYLWDREKNKPVKKNDDTCDANRYGLSVRPVPSKLPVYNAGRAALKLADPLSAMEWESLEARRAERTRASRGIISPVEALMEETPEPGSEFISSGYEW